MGGHNNCSNQAYVCLSLQIVDDLMYNKHIQLLYYYIHIVG